MTPKDTERARQRAKSARRRAQQLATDPEGFRLREARRLQALRSRLKSRSVKRTPSTAALSQLFKTEAPQ